MKPFLLILSSLVIAIAGGRLPAAELADQLQPLIDDHDGDVAVCVRHLETGETFQYRGAEVHPTASLIKLAVMITAYQQADAGQLDLNQMITLREDDKVPGSGILTDHFSSGVSISVRDAIRLMIVWSDNTATNLVVDRIGIGTTASAMESMGLSDTKLHSLVYRRDSSIFPERSAAWGLGSTTAEETAALLERLYRGEAASADACAEMLEHLEQCDDRTKLARDLPKSVRFAHKSGAVSKTRCNAGILFTENGPVAVCVLTTNNVDTSWGDDNAAHRLCGRIGLTVYRHFSPRSSAAAPEAGLPLRSGAMGTLVEMLQRTLNARMQPPPELSVDGDFGPATEAAVRAFQQSSGLDVTGIADKATVAELGPLLDEGSVPEPGIVNAEQLSVRPADPLQGVPFVTCRAWVIVDAESGETVGGHDASRPLDIASTTKVMTAWLVLKHAQHHPDCLDEVLTMSVRADETSGSTSAVRAGEQLSVREALYGLMLPSGNDMSVALAEHFGGRLRKDADESADPLDLFVQAMNEEAVTLGMEQTTYRNPHGLTARGHISSCRDLSLLAQAVFADPLFRHYVATRQRGTTVIGSGGYQRNVVWKNTNQLLGIEGYDGIKTGTTSAAGACLISTAVRGNRRLFAVVLGSAASASRYTDTRNLYRWAWNELGVSE